MMKIRAGIVAGLVILSLFGRAQNNINSPYSRYGLGELYGKNISTRLFSMGGIAYGIADPYTINQANPASYAAYDSLSFLLETGISGNIVSLQNTVSSEKSNYVTLSHFAVGFPITKWWRTSLGILPYSKIGYNVKVTVNLSNFSNVVNELNGDGGLNRLYWGNGFKLGKNLRVGFNALYVFGEERNSSIIYFPDSAFIIGTKSLYKNRGSDFLFDYGIQYDFHFKNMRILTLGATYSNQTNFKVKRSYLFETLTGGHNEIVEKVKDTLAYQSQETGTLLMPNRFGIGFSYTQKGNWTVGADYNWENWKSYRFFGTNDSLQNSWKVAVGGEYIPKHTSISPLYKRMSYRMGFRYHQTYINIRKHSINVLGISFGVKFPMKRSKTTINLGIEFGQRGTLQDNLLKENFFNFSLGLSILEHWFYKQKYQ